MLVKLENTPELYVQNNCVYIIYIYCSFMHKFPVVFDSLACRFTTHVVIYLSVLNLFYIFLEMRQI